MKLFEISGPDYPNFPIFAWLEPSRGPEDINGVRLAYIEPTKARYEYNLANAIAANDERWIRNVKQMGEKIAAGKQYSYTTPDLGWWDSVEAFESGNGGFGGVTKDKLQAKYPDLHFVKSRDEAIIAAKQAGII